MLTVEQLVAFAQEQPPSVVASVVATALLGVYTLLNTLARRSKSSAFVYPQPKSTLPVLGNSLDALFYQNARLYDWFTEESEAAGGKPWLFSTVGSVPVVILSDAAVFEDITKTQFDIFDRGAEEAAYFVDLFGKGILGSDGDVWFFHRKTASNLFSNQMIRDVMYEAVREKAQTLVKVIRAYEAKGKDNGDRMSMKNVLAHFTSDVFGKIGFGVDLHCLENDLAGKPGSEFIDAFAISTKIMFSRYQQPMWFWKLKRFLSVGAENELAQHISVIDKFIFRVINESIVQKNAREASGDDDSKVRSKDLISLFLSSKVKEDEDLKGKAFDSEMHLIRDTVVNFIFAGKDTTSNNMAYFILMMNRYPQVLKKIRAELNEKLPGLVSGETPIPSIDDLPQLTYLEAAMRENLRLNPALGIGSRQANADTVLCDGTPIAKGTRVVLCTYALGRSKEAWGEDALEFKPERWFDNDTGKLISQPPFKFMPFWAGPRQCIGMKFAMMEMKCTLAVLLSQFEFKTEEDPWSVTYDPALTMSVKGPMMVNVVSLTNGVAA
ncbi:Cytochrome p450 [Globisporangium polare]